MPYFPGMHIDGEFDAAPGASMPATNPGDFHPLHQELSPATSAIIARGAAQARWEKCFIIAIAGLLNGRSGQSVELNMLMISAHQITNRMIEEIENHQKGGSNG